MGHALACLECRHAACLLTVTPHFTSCFGSQSPAYCENTFVLTTFFQEFIELTQITWETFGSSRGPPGDPQEAPRAPQGTSQGTSQGSKTSNSHQTHIEQTSASHRPHIKLMSNSQRTTTYIQIFYRECNSRYLASGDRMLTLSLIHI